MDGEVAQSFQRILEKQGIKFRLVQQGDGRREGQRQARSPRSSRRRAARRRRSKQTWCSSPSAACPTPRASDSRKPASRSTPRSASWSMGTSRPTFRRLCHRRRDRRADARAQGRGRGRRGCRDHRRPGGHVNYDVIPERHLHEPGGRLRRQDRGGVEGGGHRLHGRQVPVHRQRPRQGQRRPMASSRCWPTPRPTASSASTSSARMPANDRGGGRDHGVRRLGGGSGAHLSRASDVDGSRQGSGARRRQAANPPST